jgi:hypothetical protein
MHPRAELAIGAAIVVGLAVAAGSVGLRQARETDADDRRSTFLAGPAGARGFAEALERMGVRVERYRRPIATLEPPGVSPHVLVAFLGPSERLSAREGRTVAALRADLLIAGTGASSAFRCLGYEVSRRGYAGREITPPPGAEARRFPAARAVLIARRSAVAVDSSDADDGGAVGCTAPVVRAVDTLLRTTEGAPVVLALALRDGRRVTLVADDRWFSNRALRETAAGPFALSLVAPRYRRFIADEYHHGFDASRTLGGAALAWTLHSPWGWAVIQLVGVSLLALVAAGVRFGPVRAGIERRRRSPLEHVRALATALAAARGHDVAIGLIVQGLRRRLSGAGRVSRGGTAAWLEGMAPSVRTPRGRAAFDALTAIVRRPATSEDVLQAADAVETLWEELTPT